ncbi:Protocadherin Alpha-2 [Manis pentadactyla]|nr:Protocadherin Alpha-2 [Manis pentadactyla]
MGPRPSPAGFTGRNSGNGEDWTGLNCDKEIGPWSHNGYKEQRALQGDPGRRTCPGRFGGPDNPKLRQERKSWKDRKTEEDAFLHDDSQTNPDESLQAPELGSVVWHKGVSHSGDVHQHRHTREAVLLSQTRGGGVTLRRKDLKRDERFSVARNSTDSHGAVPCSSQQSACVDCPLPANRFKNTKGPYTEDLCIRSGQGALAYPSVYPLTGVALATGPLGSQVAPVLPSEAEEPIQQMLQNLLAAHPCKYLIRLEGQPQGFRAVKLQWNKRKLAPPQRLEGVWEKQPWAYSPDSSLPPELYLPALPCAAKACLSRELRPGDPLTSPGGNPAPQPPSSTIPPRLLFPVPRVTGRCS